MKKSLIADPLGFILEAVRGCVDEASVLDVLTAEPGGEDVVAIRLVDGALLVAPREQALEALANVAHVFCLDEYGLHNMGRFDAVVDVGGFLGFFSIHAWRVLGAKVIHVYEPNPRARRLLEENLAMNLGDSVAYRVYGDAVAGRDGWGTLYIPRGSWPNASLLRGYAARHGPVAETLHVRLVDAAAVVSRAAGTGRLLVKIDAEGVEEEIARRIAEAGAVPDAVIVEAHSRETAWSVARTLGRTMKCLEPRQLRGTEQYIVKCGAEAP